MNRCHVCGRELDSSDVFFHKRCSVSLFQSPTPPIVEYTWDEMNALAELVVQRRIAVPGAQPKISVHIEKNGGSSQRRLTIVGFEGGYILKPPTKRYPNMPELEHFCMTLAGLCGIETVEFGLIPLNSGELAYITKRMDRAIDGVLHMEDFCQLTDKLTESKYRGSMEQVGKTLRRFSDRPGLDAIALFEITLFSFLTGNSDMHLKNFSLLRLRNGEYRLAPAYDLLPVKIILPEDQEESALSINGKKNKLLPTDFAFLAKHLKMTENQTANAVSRIIGGVKDSLSVAFKRSFLSADDKSKMQDLIESRLLRMAETI